jgi:hypothetical protein
MNRSKRAMDYMDSMAEITKIWVNRSFHHHEHTTDWQLRRVILHWATCSWARVHRAEMKSFGQKWSLNCNVLKQTTL